MAKLRVDKIASVGVSTETTGSVFFDGTGDYLSPDPGDPDLILGDTYTVEWWHYLQEVGSGGSDRDGFIFSSTDEGTTANGSGRLAIYTENDGSSGQFIRVRANGTGSDVSTTSVVVANVWQHWAVSVDSNSCKIFLNGHLQVTGNTNGSVTEPIRRIGSVFFTNDDYSTKGYISNLRILKDVALYTEDFVPSTKELEVIDGTVLLCCYDGHNKNSEKLGKPLKAVGDPLSSPTPTSTASPVGVTTNNPGLIRDVDNTFGPTFQGGAAYASQNWLTLPRGTTTERNQTGGRGITGGGNNPANTNVIDYFTISSTGNAFDFGDLTESRRGVGACASSTRGIFAGGGGSPNPAFTNTIEFVTIATTGDAADFGNLDDPRRNIEGLSSQTRGVWAGGSKPAIDNVIEFITISTLGDTTNFGTLQAGEARVFLATAESTTRGLFAGGYGGPSPLNGVKTIDFITIASTGNAQNFGDLFTGAYNNSGTSSSTRAIFAGGYNPTLQDNIEYVTISTLGNGQDFGNLIATNRGLRGTSNKIRGVFSGGDTPTITNTLQYITISSTGNAKDFGDLTSTIENQGSCSDSHGGLS